MEGKNGEKGGMGKFTALQRLKLVELLNGNFAVKTFYYYIPI
jgi:hypothetical protein